MTEQKWLLAELQRAAEQYRAIPEWAKPVSTAPYFAGRQDNAASRERADEPGDGATTK